jgi:cyclophilin family peptidyl-prolyl cis-trans isomerase
MEAWSMHRSRLFAHWPLVAAAVASLFILGCGSGKERPAASIGTDTDAVAANGEAARALTEPVQVLANEASPRTPASGRLQSPVAPEVLMKTNLGDIRIRLNAEKSPVTVDNFLSNYTERGYYDQTILHYVDKGFMIAGGGYTEDLQTKPTRAYIKSEADNGLKNLRGTVAMARLPEHADSATSQFFINLVDNPVLDFQDSESADKQGYCVFGEVIAGMDVVDRVADVAVVDKDQFPKVPIQPILVESVRRVR